MGYPLWMLRMVWGGAPLGHRMAEEVPSWTLVGLCVACAPLLVLGHQALRLPAGHAPAAALRAAAVPPAAARPDRGGDDGEREGGEATAASVLAIDLAPWAVARTVPSDAQASARASAPGRGWTAQWDVPPLPAGGIGDARTDFAAPEVAPPPCQHPRGDGAPGSRVRAGGPRAGRPLAAQPTPAAQTWPETPEAGA